MQYAAPGAVFLLNTPHSPETVWDELLREVQEAILEKHIKLHVIDGDQVARDCGLGGRINTVMQPCFFALSEVLPREQAIDAIKKAIERTYSRRGPAVVQRNFAAVDAALEQLHEATVPGRVTARTGRRPLVPAAVPEFVREVTAWLLADRGDELPVSQAAERRYVPCGHLTLREEGNRTRDPPLGAEPLHSVREVSDGLPPRGDPHEGL